MTPIPPPTAIPASASFSLCYPHLLPSTKRFEIPCVVCTLTEEEAWEKGSQPDPGASVEPPQKAAFTPSQRQYWQCGILATDPSGSPFHMSDLFWWFFFFKI